MELFKSRTRVVYTNAVGDKVYPVVVDIKKGIKSTEDIQFVSSDVNTGILSVAFISGNDNFNVSGADVVCSVMRPDASTLELPCEVVGENIVEVPLGINGTSQDGVYSFDFKVLKGGNKVVGTPIMNYSVSLSIGNDMAVEEDDRLPVLTMLITQVTELKDEAREVINQANTATEATKVATANAIEATNNANAVSERVSQEIATAIAEIKQDTENAIDSINQSTSTAISTMNQNTTDAIADMTQKTNEAVTRVNDNLTNINNTVATKVAELDTAKSDMTTTVSNKVNEVETRFNALTSSQQQDAEVIDARDGETSLKARLDRDIEKAKQVYVNVEGSHISTDSSVGYLKDVEILGNTIQSASNLADIRSVGEKVEGQELYEIPVVSCGKNINTSKSELGGLNGNNGTINNNLIDRFMRSADFIKVTPNSDIITNMNGYPAIFEYDENFDFIKYTSGVKIRTSENTRYLKFHWERTDITIPIQFEYGTVATPYEPYQEDKLTILSPVQLEKVGDVADRIIEKDGVFGVEKNVDNIVFNGSEQWQHNSNTKEFYLTKSNYIYDGNCGCICDKFTYGETGGSYNNVIKLGNAIFVSLRKDDITNVNDFKAWLQNNNVLVMFITPQPQFIPLPHDQQVKLRTFANKTNISFLTEIEGTIKAQVPKSLGATVNTHTEQINNLNKELDRVKKLEESTVSTVTTESDFTTVEATSNGYFEDVKLEGKTLVVNSDNEVVEPGTEGAILKSVGQDVEEVSVASVNSDETQSDKKRLLFYNNETQTWEKPILREWDSIEKHSDGKYYYHQRSGEVVLNGSEEWGEFPKPFENTIAFQLHMPLVKHTTDVGIVADKIQGVSHLKVNNEDVEGISLWDSQSFIRFRINKSKLSTQDVQGFKQWLQANNVTVVYQLAEEKVYECTNIDLITYANETNYIVESGVLSPKTTLKVHNNISNVVSLLQKKVSILESNITNYMIIQNRMQLASTYSADSVTFKVDYFSLCGDEENYDEDLYNLILNNILVGKDNYDYDKMFTIILDYASWNQISWEQFDILVGLMDIQHNPPVEELPTEDIIEEDIIENEEAPVE